MSSRSEVSPRELVAFIAPPRSIKTMIHQVAMATGLHPRIVRKAWHGEQVSKRASEALRAIASQKLQIAAAFESGNAADRALADKLRDQAHSLNQIADR